MKTPVKEQERTIINVSTSLFYVEMQKDIQNIYIYIMHIVPICKQHHVDTSLSDDAPFIKTKVVCDFLL